MEPEQNLDELNNDQDVLMREILTNLKQRVKEIQNLEEMYVDKNTLLADLQWDEWWFGSR